MGYVELAWLAVAALTFSAGLVVGTIAVGLVYQCQ